MSDDTLKMHSPDLTQDNIAKIRAAFPGCVTEAKDANGKLKLAVDFDQLRQELSDHIVEGPQERYQLNWPGKREALITANAPIAKTLRPVREESVNFDTTRNLFIEGDNLDALKLLQETYLAKVKMIYIDPPYNTGNDFIYEDDFAEDSDAFLKRSNQKDEGGNRLVANSAANGRFHSDWLSSLYPRLKRSKDLLTKDGAIFISINDKEIHNIRNLCSEIFGIQNFVCSFIWKSRQIIDSRNQTNSSTDHEYIVVYAKSCADFSLLGKGIEVNKYSNLDDDSRGPWMSNSILGLANASQRPNLHYAITDPETGLNYMCPPDSGWRYSRETMGKKIEEKRIIFPKKADGRPREKKFQNELNSDFTGYSSVLPETVGFTLNGSRELRDLLEGKYFDFPKPVSLIHALIEQGTIGSSDTVLDFFAGSGTTADAVFRLNASKGTNHNFIVVQLPAINDETSETAKAGYSTISELSKERIRRAGKKILEGECHPDWNKDVGFRVLKIDTSNMRDVYYAPEAIKQEDLLSAVENIKPDRTPEDLLFQVLVDWGVDLTLPITRQTLLGKTVFFVDENALVACFDQGISEELVTTLTKHKPLRAVFRDTGLARDDTKINIKQIFRQLSPSTSVKSI